MVPAQRYVIKTKGRLMMQTQKRITALTTSHLSYSLNSLKGVIEGIIYGTTIGVIKGDTRSLDDSIYEVGFLYGFSDIQSIHSLALVRAICFAQLTALTMGIVTLSSVPSA